MTLGLKMKPNYFTYYKLVMNKSIHYKFVIKQGISLLKEPMKCYVSQAWSVCTSEEIYFKNTIYICGQTFTHT